MSTERWFRGQGELTAEGPLLPAAAAWLVKALGPAAASAVLVVPGRRAGRRLRYLVASELVETGIPALAPRPITPGELPELLYSRGPTPLASPIACRLAWIRALREADPDDLLVLTRRRPEASDLTRWSALAEQLSACDEELAAAGHDFASVRAHCAGREGFRDVLVWERQSRLHARYKTLLGEAGFVDKHGERRDAWSGNRPLSAPRAPLVLIGCHDLNRLTERLLDTYPGGVTALIDGLPEDAGGYDRHGSVDSAAWAACRLPLRDEQIVIVDQPHDQIEAAVEALASLGGETSIDDVTIAAGDPALISVAARVLALAGIPARAAERGGVADSPPALLISAVADHLGERPRWETLASLVRHPDVAQLLENHAVEGVEPLPADWLAKLDEFSAAHLPYLCAKDIPSRASKLKSVSSVVARVETLLSLLPKGERELSAWAGPLSEFLSTIYGQREVERGNPLDAPLYYALNQIGNCLKSLVRIGETPSLDPACDAAAAIRFVLKLSSDSTVPDETGQPAVELLQWLEAPPDDAPVLIVIGCNEGCVPKSAVGHARLPDALRAELGLPDNARHFARDAASLSAMARTRQSLTVIAGRRSAEGDPLAPSRLLLASNEETVVRRAIQFFGEESHAAPRRRRLGLKGQEIASFAVPRAEKPWPADKPIPVTAFRQYLTCPFQFYLRHVERLQEPDDREIEMDGGLFGSLAHDVLAAFARSDLRDSADSGEIETFVQETLRDEVKRKFGRDPEPAVLLQRDQLSQRLRFFARKQAGRAAMGWRIRDDLSERAKTVEAVLVPESGIRIHGRIDRVDQNVLTSRIAIIDYKTSDSPSTPEKAHREKRNGEMRWIDLQLPLYQLLAAALDLETEMVDLAYFNIPAEEGKVEIAVATWQQPELDEAHDEARRIAKLIFSGGFPPSMPDGRRRGDFTGVRFAGARGWRTLAADARRAGE